MQIFKKMHMFRFKDNLTDLCDYSKKQTKLDALLKECEPFSELSAEDLEWLNLKAVGKEIYY